MNYIEHPIFGRIAVDPDDLSPEDRAMNARFGELEAELAEAQKAEVAYFQRLMDYELDGIGQEPEIPSTLRAPSMRQPKPRQDVPQEFHPKTHTDANGIVYDFMRPGTLIGPGDFEDTDENLWRPRMAAKQATTRYDRAFLNRLAAERELAETIQRYGEGDTRTNVARQELEAAQIAQSKALRDASDPKVQERERIDLWRQSDEGREAYNAGRRDRQSANADLSGMTAEQKAARKRQQAAERKRRQRAAKRTENQSG